MTAGLRIADGVELPIDTVTQSIAVLARKGAGKTYTSDVIAEEVIDARVPCVILDPTGAHWGLKSSADGTGEGYAVTVFGGDHADAPLDAHDGKVLAEVILEHPGAYIFDLSAFASKADELRFAAAFLETLYRGKKPESGPLLVIVDEADMFAPQRTERGGDVLRTLGALESIVRRGRIKGLGCLLITQRAAVLNKNVLTQTEILIVGQTTGPQDIAAVREWILGFSTKDEAETFVKSLPPLGKGEMWVWSPSFLGSLRKVQIRTRRTFDSSRTPTAGEVVVTPTVFAPVDLEALGERVAAARQQAKDNDPTALRARIVTLERQLAERPESDPIIQTVTTTERVEVPILTDADRALFLETARSMREGYDSLGEHLGAFGRAIAPALEFLNAGRDEPAPPPPAPAPRPVARPAPSAVVTRPPEVQASVEPRIASTSSLTGYGRRLLETIARHHPMAVTRAQLAALSNSSPRSSSFDAAIGEIRKRGLVAADFAMLPAGWDELGSSPPAPRAPEETRAMWRASLPKAAAALFDHVVASYPEPLTRAELSERSGYSPTSSSFDSAITILRKNGLLDDAGPGVIRAAEVLFL